MAGSSEIQKIPTNTKIDAAHAARANIAPIYLHATTVDMWESGASPVSPAVVALAT